MKESTPVEVVLNVLAERCYENSKEHGFWDDYDKTQRAISTSDVVDIRALSDKYCLDAKLSKIALMVSELGEAVEGVRKPGFDEHCTIFSNEAIELADAIIRIMDYCGRFYIPIGEAVVAKMAFNATR